jgi:prevent-host-death family protein
VLGYFVQMNHVHHVHLTAVDVAVSALRAHLSDWLERARSGEEVVITDRGVPVARLIGVDTTSILEELTERGVIDRPARTQRPKASGRRRARTQSSVTELVSEQRR